MGLGQGGHPADDVERRAPRSGPQRGDEVGVCSPDERRPGERGADRQRTHPSNAAAPRAPTATTSREIYSRMPSRAAANVPAPCTRTWIASSPGTCGRRVRRSNTPAIVATAPTRAGSPAGPAAHTSANSSNQSAVTTTSPDSRSKRALPASAAPSRRGWDRAIEVPDDADAAGVAEQRPVDHQPITTGFCLQSGP